MFQRMVCLLVATGCLLGAPALFADDIDVFDSAFLPTFVTITQGEQVCFVWDDDPDNGEHNFTITPPAGSGLDDIEFTLDEDNPTFSILLNIAGFYDVDDDATPLSGTISVEEFEVEVEVVDNDFIPVDVSIFEGDKVHWFYMDMIDHTVTSGLDLDDPELGELFDVAIGYDADEETEFEYIFEDPGSYPYLCIPHADMGMVGTVTVQRHFIRGDANGDLTLNIGDPILILAYLFLDETGDFEDCLDQLDANDDGDVTLPDATDLLDALFSPTAPDLPAPFPGAGPDRTDDDNLCEESTP